MDYGSNGQKMERKHLGQLLWKVGRNLIQFALHLLPMVLPIKKRTYSDCRKSLF